MNHWQNEVLAEQRREEIQAEAEHGRLEAQALAARQTRTGWYSRRMFNLGNWMIATGKQLRRRHELRSPDSTQPVRGSLVR